MKRIFTIALLLLAQTTIAQVEYKDVAGIFFSRCTSCHHEGGAGPFPFMNYSQTISFSNDIFDAINDGRMPPWSPDTTYSRFLHERIITDVEKNKILTWITNGTPAGDTTLAPPAPTYGAYQLLGTPSMTLQIPTFVSNATTTDSYVCFSIPTNLVQDRYLRAFEIVPGNPAIVHHAVVTVDTVGNTVNDLSGTCYTIPGNFGLGGFAPGAPPTVMPGVAPLKLGMPIKAGSKIVMQMHYPAGSAGMVDSTKIRLYFYPINEPGIRTVRDDVPLQNWSLFLPPNQISTFTASFPPQPLPITIFSLFPHSHDICTSIINYAFNGNDTVKLIRINNWDFEWQGYYSFRFPVKIPAGYQLFSSHVYDNTSANLNNPNNPPQLVIAGLSTSDEMLFDAIQWTLYLPGDELIDVGALLANDTLLVSSVTENPILNSPSITVVAFPNPSSQNFTFRLNGQIPENSEIRIFNIFGELVNVLPKMENAYGSYFTNWNGRNFNDAQMPPGVYYYSLKSGTYNTGGKLILLLDM